VARYLSRRQQLGVFGHLPVGGRLLRVLCNTCRRLGRPRRSRSHHFEAVRNLCLVARQAPAATLAGCRLGLGPPPGAVAPRSLVLDRYRSQHPGLLFSPTAWGAAWRWPTPARGPISSKCRRNKRVFSGTQKQGTGRARAMRRPTILGKVETRRRSPAPPPGRRTAGAAPNRRKRPFAATETQSLTPRSGTSPHRLRPRTPVAPHRPHYQPQTPATCASLTL